MSKYLLKRFTPILFIPILFLITACSSSFLSENDISTLNPKYFIKDSVKSTHVKILLNWQPKVDDRVKIRVRGSICSSIEFSSEWMSDASILLDIDADTENLLSVELIFELSSFYPYDASFALSIDGKHLINENLEIYKEPGAPFTIQRFVSYLPLFRSSGILTFGSTKFLCPEHPVSHAGFRPDCFDSLSFDSSFDIREQFTLSIESQKNNVIFYDRLLRTSVGKTVKARLNEFQKYEVLLLESENSVVNDTIIVTYSCPKFTINFNFLVRDECPPLKEPKQLIINFNKKAFPGDTVIVIPSFINENGEEEYFSEDTEFDVFIRNNCEFADIIGPEGQLGNFFGEMKQPIKVIVLGIPEDGSFGVGVGLVPNAKYGSYLKY